MPKDCQHGPQEGPQEGPQAAAPSEHPPVGWAGGGACSRGLGGGEVWSLLSWEASVRNAELDRVTRDLAVPTDSHGLFFALAVLRYLCDKVVPGNRVTIMGIYSIKKFGLTSGRGRDRVGVGIRSSYIRVLGIQVDTDGSGELAVGPLVPAESLGLLPGLALHSLFCTVAMVCGAVVTKDTTSLLG